MNRRELLLSLGLYPISLASGQGLPGPGLKYTPSYRFVGCYFGEKQGVGGYIYKCYMLYSGEVVIDYNFLPGKEVISNFNGPRTLYHPDHFTPEKVLEYRSSHLIYGSITNVAERFLPELGAKVISFDAYKEGMPRIYNLPGFFSERKRISIDSNYNNKTGKYDITPTHQAALRTSVEPLPTHYYCKKLTDKFGEHVCFGTITEHGNFDYDVKPGIIRDPEAIKKSKLPPNLYAPREGEEFVYEFRSEKLILGKVTGSAFVPEKGSEVVAYDDYRSKKLKQLRIYNLPEKYKR